MNASHGRWLACGLAALTACTAAPLRADRVTLEGDRYRVSWAQPDARYVRVVRLDRRGILTAVDPTGPVERRAMQGRHTFALPITDLPDLLVLLSREPLGEEPSAWPTRCPAMTRWWGAGAPGRYVRGDREPGSLPSMERDGGADGGLDGPCVALYVAFAPWRGGP